MEELRLKFPHGLGDCVMFSRVLKLYLDRGYSSSIAAWNGRDLPFKLMGCDILDKIEPPPPPTQQIGGVRKIPNDPAGIKNIAYWEPPFARNSNNSEIWEWNKAVNALKELPKLADPKDLWNELVHNGIKVSEDYSSSETIPSRIKLYLEKLPCPIILLHSRGLSNPHIKNLSDDFVQYLASQILTNFDGTVVLLDNSFEIPRFKHRSFRSLKLELGDITTSELLELILNADFMIGIDSGPSYLASFTNTPTIAIFPTVSTIPMHYGLPSSNLAYLCVVGDFSPKVRLYRSTYNLLEVTTINEVVNAIVYSIKDIFNNQRLFDDVSTEMSFNQLLRWCSPILNKGKDGIFFHDRNRGYKKAFEYIKSNIKTPRIVETGCMNSFEWQMNGNSSYMFGFYISKMGGTLDTIDISSDNIQFAQNQTFEFKDKITYHVMDSLSCLRNQIGDNKIDVLYLDSIGFGEPRYIIHTQDELQIALPKMADNSIIGIDDTQFDNGIFYGRGAKAAPYLLENGWALLHSGHQQFFIREKYA